MKTTSNNYAVLVSQGKTVVNNRKNSQRHLADLAMRACTIRYGGRYGNLYTMKQYARDIGVNSKTLSKWIQERRVEITINKNSKSKKKKTLSEIKKITRTLRGDTKIGKDGQSKYMNFQRIKAAEIRSKSVGNNDLEKNIRKLREVLYSMRSMDSGKFTDKDKKNLKILLKKCNDIIK